MMRLKKKKGFTLVEALIAIWAMVVACAAILSAFVSSSQLRVFSENFTRGINACQQELENIRYRYKQAMDPTTQLDFAGLLNLNGTDFNVLDADGEVNSDFAGRILAQDPYQDPSKSDMFVQLTARMAFRQGTRIVGGELQGSQLVPDKDTPCQLTILLTE